VIRDTEAEQLLREYTRPILRAAGLEKQNIQIVIINDAAFNAFVADGRRIFVNFGALMQSETPNQIIGVLAHETGHLAGGHLAKMREQLAQAQAEKDKLFEALAKAQDVLIKSTEKLGANLDQTHQQVLAVKDLAYITSRQLDDQREALGLGFPGEKKEQLPAFVKKGKASAGQRQDGGKKDSRQ
jgi:predicted Zn-dependent protease